MARRSKIILEYRKYELPPHFPIRLISGDKWHISDIPSGVLHFHNCMEIGLCESGGGSLRFTAGDISVISSDTPHTTYSDPGTASKWSYLFVDPEELLLPFFPLNMLPHAELFQGILHGYRNLFSLARFPVIHRLAWQIVQEMGSGQLNYEISVRGLFLSLITELMRAVSALPGSGSTYSAIPIAPALQYMERHYMENFTMRVPADLCHMSPSHFRRVFGHIMGTGPLEHLTQIRIAKACTLLRMTEDSILHISEQVGFGSLSSFNRHFSAIHGESPTKWRKRMNVNQSVSILRYSGWLVPPPSG